MDPCKNLPLAPMTDSRVQRIQLTDRKHRIPEDGTDYSLLLVR